MNEKMMNELREMISFGYYPEWCVINHTNGTETFLENYEQVNAYLANHATDDCAICCCAYAA